MKLKIICFAFFILLTNLCVAQDEPAETEDVENAKFDFVLRCTMASGKTERMNISYNTTLEQWEYFMPANGSITSVMSYNKNENVIDLYLNGAHFGEMNATFSNYTPKDVDDFIVNGVNGGGQITAGQKFTWIIIKKK